MNKRTDAEIEAAQEIYNAGKAAGEMRVAEAEAALGLERSIGFLQKIDIDSSYNKLLRYMTLYKIKEAKIYQCRYKTWDDFCSDMGLVVRTVDKNITDLRPLLDNFSEHFSEIFTIPFNKIRYLGRALSEQSSEIKNGELVVGDTRIPLKPENKDDIEALIDEMKAAHKKAVEERESEVGALRKMNDNKRADIERLEKKIAKMEHQAVVQGLEPGEEAFMDLISRQRTTFHGLCIWLDPENEKCVPPDATPRMKAAYMEMLGYMLRLVTAAYHTAQTIHGDPEVDCAWEQPSYTPTESKISQLSAVCEQCKSSHPDCDGCCAKCNEPCNIAQKCRLPGDAEVIDITRR